MRASLLLFPFVSAIFAETVLTSAMTTVTISTALHGFVPSPTFTMTISAKPVYKLVYVRGIYTFATEVTMPYFQNFEAVCTGNAIIAFPSVTIFMKAPVLATTVYNLTSMVTTVNTTFRVPYYFSEVLSNSFFIETVTDAFTNVISTIIAVPAVATLMAKATIIPQSTLTCIFNVPPTITYYASYYVNGPIVGGKANPTSVYVLPITATVLLNTKYINVQPFPVSAIVNGTAKVTVYSVNFEYTTPTPENATPGLGLVAIALAKALKPKRGRGA